MPKILAENPLLRLGRTIPLQGLFRFDMPDGPLTVKLVVAQYPVAYEKRSVGGDRHADGAEIFAALDERFSIRRERRTAFFNLVAFNAMIGPGGHEQVAAIFVWKPVGFIA